MAKNKVSPEKPIKKQNDSLVKSRSKFKSKYKVGFRNTDSQGRYKGHAYSLKPSESSSGNFFVKAIRTASLNQTSENSDIKKDNVSDSFFIKSSRDEIPSKPNKVMHSNKIHKRHCENKNEKQNKLKPFDKKTWRMQKYSKSYKLQQWENKRKHSVLRGYYQSLKEDENKFDIQQIYQDKNENGADVKTSNQDNTKSRDTILNQPSSHESSDMIVLPKSSREKKKESFIKAKLTFQRIQEEKQKTKEEALRKKAEKEDALRAYKKKKNEAFKKLNRKTRKGQPIMKDRMEMLLKKIQISIDNNK